MQTRLRFAKYTMIFALAVLLGVPVFALFKPLANTVWLRAFLVLPVAIGSILFVHAQFFTKEQEGDSADPPVRFAIAFDSLVFVVLGVAASVVISPKPALAALVAGSSLLFGGFIGLLFGYPQGVAEQTATPKALPLTGQDAATTRVVQQKNLLAEASSTLGKVIAGFTLAKGDKGLQWFQALCTAIGPELGSKTIAGSIIVYFLCVGVLSGLLLPSYFMQGYFAENR